MTPAEIRQRYLHTTRRLHSVLDGIATARTLHEEAVRSVHCLPPQILLGISTALLGMGAVLLQLGAYLHLASFDVVSLVGSACFAMFAAMAVMLVRPRGCPNLIDLYAPDEQEVKDTVKRHELALQFIDTDPKVSAFKTIRRMEDQTIEWERMVEEIIRRLAPTAQVARGQRPVFGAKRFLFGRVKYITFISLPSSERSDAHTKCRPAP
jgi:hypothetical protein